MRPPIEHLSLPFFAAEHRALAEALLPWAAAQDVDEADDRAACRDWVARLGQGGFLRYWSKGPEFAAQLAGMKASTDMAPYLSLIDQKRLRIALPPISEQRAIAHILGTLDDKIELNRRRRWKRWRGRCSSRGS